MKLFTKQWWLHGKNGEADPLTILIAAVCVLALLALLTYIQIGIESGYTFRRELP